MSENNVLFVVISNKDIQVIDSNNIADWIEFLRTERTKKLWKKIETEIRKETKEKQKKFI